VAAIQPALASLLFRIIPAMVLLVATLGWSPAGAQESLPPASFLYYSSWQADAFSHHADGTMCWLTDRAGSLRLEVQRDARMFPTGASATNDPWPDQLNPLLNRRGEGWTVILGPDDEGTLNAWGREWSRPPAGLVQMIRLATVTLAPQEGGRLPGSLALALVSGRGEAGIPCPSVLDPGSGGSKVRVNRRYQLAPLEVDGPPRDKDSGFRDQMKARGRGTGGTGEIVTLAWRDGADAPEPTLRIRSSRRPGTLEIQSPLRVAVPPPEPEVFLPLWPLSQFF